MKTILTMMLSLVMVSVAFAQHKDYSRDKKYSNERRASTRDFEAQRRNDMIAKVNYDYDKRIFWVKQSNMRLRDKKKEIRQLEKERNNHIKSIYARFDNNNRKARYPQRHDHYVIH